jgi:hypothetical protein
MHRTRVWIGSSLVQAFPRFCDHCEKLGVLCLDLKLQDSDIPASRRIVEPFARNPQRIRLINPSSVHLIIEEVCQ